MYVFLNDKYRNRYRYRRYWPCIYLVSDRYQNLQYRTPLVTRRPVFPRSHNSLSNNKVYEGGIGGIALIEVRSLSLSRARTLHFFSSHTARDQFSVLKYTHSSPNVCRVSHVNTVGYGLNERITGG